MTREELKEHCERQIQICETWAISKGEEPHGKVYEEHKLILELLEQEPCDDCINRAEVKKIAKEMYLEVANMELDVKTISDCISYTSSKCREVFERKLQTLSSVTSIRPKGQWIHGHCGKDDYIRCNKCGKEIVQNIVTLEGDIAEEVFNFCPICGCPMREVEE